MRSFSEEASLRMVHSTTADEMGSPVMKMFMYNWSPEMNSSLQSLDDGGRRCSLEFD